MSLIEESKKDSTSELIILYSIEDPKKKGTDRPDAYYFTASISGKGTSIRFNGNAYIFNECDMSGVQQKANAPVSPATFKLNLIGTTLNEVIDSKKNFIGWEFTRTITLAKFLDGRPDADPTVHFPLSVYKIRKKNSQTRNEITFSLAHPLDFKTTKLPGRQIIRDYCTHSYRIEDPETGEFIYENITCPFRGAQSFDRMDNPTTSDKDVCGKTINSCKKRFGKDKSLPIRTFPGVDR